MFSLLGDDQMLQSLARPVRETFRDKFVGLFQLNLFLPSYLSKLLSSDFSDTMFFL